MSKTDTKAFRNIGYGLYVVTCREGERDNALIVNTVSQVANNPNVVAVSINKENYSHDLIKRTGKMNVNCLTVNTPFFVFEAYGFKSGKQVDKFENTISLISEKGLVYMRNYINSYISLEVENYIDLGSHGMFLCSVSEAKVINNDESMTYSYYHANVKPRPATESKKGYVCKICGYVYDNDELPEDYICPICKHPASDFERIK